MVIMLLAVRLGCDCHTIKRLRMRSALSRCCQHACLFCCVILYFRTYIMMSLAASMLTRPRTIYGGVVLNWSHTHVSVRSQAPTRYLGIGSWVWVSWCPPAKGPHFLFPSPVPHKARTERAQVQQLQPAQQATTVHGSREPQHIPIALIIFYV